MCEPSFEPDLNDAYTYEIGLTTENGYFANCYRNIDYVKNNTPASWQSNILAVLPKPELDCSAIKIDGFEFIGYDLLDQSNDTSAITNCGGFDNIFSTDILNKHGLINDFATAIQLRETLFEKHPEEYHADSNVWAVWKAV